ncbi:MAG: hypothetical protein AAF655_21820 [Bacteroidota bacterium]
MGNLSHIRDLMIRSLDESLSPREQERLERGLHDFPEIEKERKKLLAFREGLAAQKHTFGPFFSTRVEARIEGLEENAYNQLGLPSLAPAFARLAIPCLGISMILLLSLLFQGQELGWNLFTGSTEIELADLWLASMVQS